MSSKPRPIHTLHRPIAQEPHPSEPQNSFPKDEDSFLYADFESFRNGRKLKRNGSSTSLRGVRKSENQRENDFNSPSMKFVRMKSVDFNGDKKTIAKSTISNQNKNSVGKTSSVSMPHHNNSRQNSLGTEDSFSVHDNSKGNEKYPLNRIQENQGLNNKRTKSKSRDQDRRSSKEMKEARRHKLEYQAGNEDKESSTDLLLLQNTDRDVRNSLVTIDLKIEEALNVPAPAKKKLNLSELNLTCKDLPISKICSPALTDSLHRLSLAGNPLLEVPKQLLFQLSALRVLDLHQCGLPCLPLVKWNFPNLRALNLSFNKLVVFPEEIIFSGIPNLRKLNLYGNHISEIILPFHPDEDSINNDDSCNTTVLSNLNTLNIGFNNLTYLPNDLNKLNSLSYLNVSKNFLEKIPRSICDLNLQGLDVESNPLVEPPVETCERGIHCIRRYFRCLKNEEKKEKGKKTIKSKVRKKRQKSSNDDDRLFSLELDGIDKVKSRERISMSRTAERPTLRRLSSLTESTENSLNEYKITVNDTLKVIFVGTQEVGKTSVIRRLCYGKGSANPDKRTIGVDIHDWTPKRIGTQVNVEGLDSSQVDRDVDVKFNVWDFAGQHVYHATHELFFSRLALYIIVWDMGHKNSKTWPNKQTNYGDVDSNEESLKALHDEIDENVQFWVECIQSSAPGAVILPIGTFNDKFIDDAEGQRRCTIMKERLLYHEQRSKDGISKRLKKYSSPTYIDSNTARRLRRLEYKDNRPKLIFGDGESIIRVSCTECSGFDLLEEKIVHIATGTGQMKNISEHGKGEVEYGLFKGHVGARIPSMRIEIKNLIRELRDKKHVVVSWEFFNQQLQNRSIMDKEDIIDTLHFLANIGEVAFFGNSEDSWDEEESQDFSDDDLFVTRNSPNLSMNATSVSQLTQFVFLNPRWLVTAIACILRHDLTRKIKNVRKSSLKPTCALEPKPIFNNVTNPTITAEDACLLWQSNNEVRQAVEMMNQSASGSCFISPYEFLQLLLMHFSVFVPIDFDARTIFGGVVQEQCCNPSRSFFLPCLLEGSIAPKDDFFSYKAMHASLITLCHSWVFQDCVPPGLMERIMASALRTVYEATDNRTKSCSMPIESKYDNDERIEIDEIMCWRTAFYLKLNGVKIFVRMAEQSSPMCVASKSMSVGTRRLTISGQGSALYAGEAIWNNGYDLVIRSIEAIIKQYGGLEYEEEVICPECLKSRHISEASYWDGTLVQDASKLVKDFMFCGNAHRIETPSLSGNFSKYSYRKAKFPYVHDDTVKIKDLAGGFVFVGVYDTTEKRIVGAGSGFIIDKEQGLIITAAHTVMYLEGSKFGQTKSNKIIVGVIPKSNDGLDGIPGTLSRPAIFRYFAKVVAKDPLINEKNVCTVDACVLKITTRLEKDVEKSQDICQQPERIMTRAKIKAENLHALDVREECEVEEIIRIIGFSQGGEGLKEEGSWLFRNCVLSHATVNKSNYQYDIEDKERTLCPRKEIIVDDCDTVVGESGGPCINQQGEVVGILSRGHATRSYLAPTSEWIGLLEQLNQGTNGNMNGSTNKRSIQRFL